jgi:type VI secretion system protein ImpC
VEYEVSFGRLGKNPHPAQGPAFRIAVLGDFSGRANSGVLEAGTVLAARKSYKVDVDNLDTLLERMSVTVSVPIDEDGQALSAPIRSLEDFHPDQLVENLPVFEELLQLRRGLQSRAGFERAAKQVMSWSGEAALPPIPVRRSRGSVVAVDRKLSDFARLTGRKPAAEAEAGELIRRLVGPFVVPARDARQDALLTRVDVALSDAMRRVLHHPDFQAVEALWRGVELLVRRIETDARLQIVLYDISAEELAADVARSNALEESALYQLLVEQPALDADQGALSLIAGLYQFEATPPHAELLGRIAQIAGAAGAPFLTSIGVDALKTPIHEWHPLTRKAWTALRELPASAYLGLATPRFLLRMPYGKRTDPIDAFGFEEFTRQGGLSGMLWGHPALLWSILIAETWRRDSKAMQLGSVTTLGDLPVYVYQDSDGEQIALPCTERLLSERQAAQVASTGATPVLSLRGRPEVRVGGFRSVEGGMLAGRWAPLELKPAAPVTTGAPDPSALAPAPTKPVETKPEPEQIDTGELDSLMADLAAPAASPEPIDAEGSIPEAPADGADSDLDALLSSLGAEPPPVEEDATEPDLDALLASLK